MSVIVRFIPELEKVTLIKELSPSGSIWTLYYKFPPPVSPRVFTVYQLTHLPPSSPGIPKEGYIVSVPIDLTSSGDEALADKEEKAVRGRYVSVEYIKELEDGGVEWIMATSSTPGGNIPAFVAEHSMPGQISNVSIVFHFGITDADPSFFASLGRPPLHRMDAKAKGTRSHAPSLIRPSVSIPDIFFRFSNNGNDSNRNER